MTVNLPKFHNWLQVLNSSSTTTSRVAKTSQRLHHITASSSSSSQSSQSQLSTTTSGNTVNPLSIQRDLNEFKNSMSEINNLAARSNQLTELQKRWEISWLLKSVCFESKKYLRIRSSIENLVDDDPSPEGLVTLPDEGQEGDFQLDLTPDEKLQCSSTNGISSDTVKFEQKRMMNSSKTKILTNGFSSEQVSE